jgi:probable DNA metabolism protein
MPRAQHTIELAGPVDLDGFRQAARLLLAEQVPPEDVVWTQAYAAHGDLFAQEDAPRSLSNQDGHQAQRGQQATPATPVRTPAFFLPLCQSAILHRDSRRFGLMYRLLWRLGQKPALKHDTLDPERSALEDLARIVRRDMHKMTAFVRFRTVAQTGDASAQEQPLHIAWFEPEHHIVEATAPFFQRRFTNMRWAILTPERCVQWDGAQLTFTPGAHRHDAPPADAGEQLWLTYYEHIFNPARLKLKMMEREMPRRYWHNLPEAALIGTLTHAAHERAARMIERGPQDMAKRLPQARPLRAAVAPDAPPWNTGP